MFNVIVACAVNGAAIALKGSDAANIPLIVSVVWTAFTIVPNLALIVRRLHDSDRSGWWWFISLVPIIGGIWFLILVGFTAGTPGSNSYGDPDQ